MKRIAWLTLFLLVACKREMIPIAARKPAPQTETVTATATTATTTTAAALPAADVKVANAPVPTAGLELWLRADSGVTAGADGKVSSWAVEGSDVKATAKSPELQPTLVQNAIGGKPALHFDGGSNMLETNISIDPAVSPEVTIVSVFNSETEDKTPLRKLYGHDDGGYDRAAGLDTRASDGSNYTIFGGSADVVGIFALKANTPYLTVDSFDNTKKVLNVWVNGAPARLNVKVDNGPGLPKFYIGGTGTVYHEQWKGSVAEMLVYHRTLSDDERKKVEDYLAGKYGLTLTR